MRRLICIGVAALVMAGCGDDGDDDATTARPGATPGTGVEAVPGGATAGGGSTGATGSTEGGGAKGGGGALGTSSAESTSSVSETEYSLAPPNPTVPAGEVTFKVSNDGRIVHSLEVEGPGGKSRLKKELPPGTKGVLKVSLGKPGTYAWYCPIGGHRDLGMAGTITVERR